MKTVFWRMLVIIFMILAVIGAILPGMPTTVFLILAAWAASKGWPEVDAWLLNHPKYGPTLKSWRENGTVPRKAKWLASIMMLMSGVVMLFTSAPFYVKLFTNVIMLSVAVWLWLRPEQKTIESFKNKPLSDADLLIDLAQQQMYVVALHQTYQISSALKGIGEAENSGKTPRGWHCIAEKIGADAPENSVFVGRIPTGEIYSAGLDEKFPQRDWILTRILWLKGLEQGFNLGEGVDTFNRYIYIHGTPDKNPMGVAQSHGCIRMHNQELIELFEYIPQNTLVYISEKALELDKIANI